MRVGQKKKASVRKLMSCVSHEIKVKICDKYNTPYNFT